MDATGRERRRFENKLTCHRISIDSLGNFYGCDHLTSFFKFTHGKSQVNADACMRVWYSRDNQANMEGKKACGISIHARNPRICYACYSTGPLVVLDSRTGRLVTRVTPFPPLVCAVSMVCASDALVVADTHCIKLYSFTGKGLAIVDSAFNDPSLLWAGSDLFIGERGSRLWACYGSEEADEVEKAHQKGRLCKSQGRWGAALRAPTPNTERHADKVFREVASYGDMDGRPLSRALGDSRKLAYSQGLTYYDSVAHRYRPGKFFTEIDAEIRQEISKLKERNPLMCVDPGNLFRPSL
ncbi:hypothetical protein T484DRAFT_3614293 [Baffinella frigidus]|nr:hypothetical protein T484DRAFT_3614293 [Cryptophyta sp. CCMP2293]